MKTYLNQSLASNLDELAVKLRSQYQTADPFPNIVIDDFFNESYLSKVLEEFPDLSKKKAINFKNPKQIKLASKGEESFGPKTKQLMHYLNSEEFLHFLQTLTGITEPLIPDPYFAGGGQHEIKKGGLLKIHADFNKHPFLELDRRINVLIYLNKNWKEEYGGHFQLWDTEMKECKKKILPKFNTLAIFSTTSNSYHGHPDALTCPEGRSRKSLALYYYSNGRPKEEAGSEHSTLFKERKGIDKPEDFQKQANNKPPLVNRLVKQILPPILLNGIRKVKNSKK